MSDEKLKALESYFADRSPMAIAVSGGVDSMTLAVVAHRAAPGTEIYHAMSPAVPDQATSRVRDYARMEGWDLHLVDAGEINDPQYVANPANRCYFCKTNLYDTVTEHTTLIVASGTNLDDLGDYRPGLIAAEEHQVCHPYVEVGITKAELRWIAGCLDLNDLKDLPAAPCLSSRVTTGIAIDRDMLPVINEVEQRLWDYLAPHLRLEGVRCRVREQAIAIQIETSSELDIHADYFKPVVQLVRDNFVAAGFAGFTMSIVIEPYARGSAFLIDTLEVS